MRTRPGAATSLFMLATMWVPLALIAAVVACWLLVPWGVWQRGAAATAMLVIVPPLLSRLLTAGLQPGQYDISSLNFKRWWLSMQLQILFSRIPLIEELIRLVPGCYNLWLWLWGSRVALTVFWAPGSRVLDRGMLDIAGTTVIGTGCILSGHVLNREGDGSALTLGRIVIDRGAVLGVESAIGPGVHIHTNETVLARTAMRPFSSWRDGRRHRED